MNTAADRIVSQLTDMHNTRTRYEASRRAPGTFVVYAKRAFAVALSTHETVEEARAALAAAKTTWANAPTELFIHSGAFGAESHTHVG